MSGATTNDALALALRALAASLADQRLAERFLSLSGIGPPDLRQRAADPALLAALLRFLEAHEPDLVAVAEDLGVQPGALVAAREELER
jgi:adenine/guanine phosphoribosyltransferase-like PRPP-binding protein